jgi:PUA domain protein
MSVKIKNKHQMKNKEIRILKEKLSKIFDCDFNFDKSVLETGMIDDKKLIFVDEKPCFLYKNGEYIFTLFVLNKFRPKNKQIVVDMGAVKFVTNGADVMSPGIVDADEDISKGDQVWICDEKNKKPLAVGIAEINGIDMKNKNKGKAVNTIFYVGDKLWNYIKNC